MARGRAAEPGPALGAWVRQPEQVEHAHQAGVHQILDAARVLIKSRHGRADDAAHLGDLEHVAQVA